jgi:NADPH:quinone reductase-like Zn-dependent oxidoreductase
MSTDSFPATHAAVVTPAKRAPLAILNVPTKPPAAGEVVVRVQWAGCTPLDLHQADGALLVQHPQILSDSFSGVAVAVGAAGKEEQELKVGDVVAGFAFQQPSHKAWQEYVTVPANLLGRVPSNISAQAAAAVLSSLVTAIHTITADLGLELPWPIPANWQPPQADTPILLWGASGTVGAYSLQVLRHWGYKRLLAVASANNHANLRDIGASLCFDYSDPNVTEQILTAEPEIPYIIDCIGSLENTLRPLSKVAQSGSKVAVMLPVIVRDATADEEPLYEMDIHQCLQGEWKDGVELRGVRTHFYQDVGTLSVTAIVPTHTDCTLMTQNAFLKEHLQPHIVPELLASGAIQPIRQRVVEGATILERAQNALDLLRLRSPSGEKLVWKVSDE